MPSDREAPAPVPGPPETQPHPSAALTLPERVTLWRSRPQRAQSDRDLASRRLSRWRSEPAFVSAPELFRERLAQDQLTETEFGELLGVSPRDLAAGEPEWWARMATAFQRGAGSSGPRAAEGLAPVALPLIASAEGRLRERLRDDPARGRPAIDVDRVLASALSTLRPRLVGMLSRAFVLDLHAARLQGLLTGDTAEARFHSYVERVSDPQRAWSVFCEYPVLVRQLDLAIEQWVNATAEVVSRLCADWPEIRRVFGSSEDWGALQELKGGVGDAHRRGRSVHLLSFASGFRLVYKPRSLAVDVHFQELLSWAEARGSPLAFRLLRIVDRDTHGWSEFVARESCDLLDGVQRFYRRLGGQLALLHVLRATDFHFENLVAAGEHPVLVDLETLFHQSPFPVDPSGGHALAAQVLGDSVLRIGLLPFRLWANAEHAEGLDVSGVGGSAGQLTPRPVGAWESGGTDDMRFVRRRVEVPSQLHRPMRGGEEADPTEYVDDLVSGFAEMTRLLILHRTELTAEEGPLARFANDPVRCLVRPTQAYASLLSESFHPQLLRDALGRERFFDHLWLGVPKQPVLARFIAHERADLHAGDIPVLCARPNARHLWSGSGARIHDVFDRTGLDAARERLRALDEAEVARQVWFIRSSLTALTSEVTRDVGAGSPRAPSPREAAPSSAHSPPEVAEEAALLDAARAVGERLTSLALADSEGTVDWVGLTLEADRYWTLAPAGLDLYSGLPGVGLFLAYLGAALPDSRFAELARRAAQTVRKEIERLGEEEPQAIGAFHALGGALYFLTHASSLWHEPALLNGLDPVFEHLERRIDGDERDDVMGGAAGAIALLLAHHCAAPSDRALSLAVHCGEHLLERAVRVGKGLGWPGAIECHAPLAGFSHGAAGVGWALSMLAHETGDERFRTAARDAFAYERTLYRPETGNWLDLRRLSEQSPRADVIAWCHGAPGIGVSRLPWLQNGDDPELREDVAVALATSLSRRVGANHSLCHGDLGNLDLALQMSDALGDAPAREETYRQAARVLDDVSQRGWRCGTPALVETPGLMVGLAGIGYGLLRLAKPAHIPSVLTLSAPR